MVAASTGYWRRQSMPFRFLALAMWKVYGPLMLALKGYVRRAVWTGARCRPGISPVAQVVPDCCAVPGPGRTTARQPLRRVRGPLLALAFTDDPIATPAAMAALLGSYSQRRSSSAGSVRDAAVRSLGTTAFAERHRDHSGPAP
jgi:hypothetical protein